MNELDIINGRLVLEEKTPCVLAAGGEKKFTNAAVWQGYITHFLNREVRGRLLPQTDYATKRPIALVWPEGDPPPQPFLEIYFNQRLPNYPGSFFGHAAINVNGRIFNFARKLNENEELDYGEYFYRPALGEFSPGANGKYDLSNPDEPRYDKFGRRFMRQILVLRITNVRDTAFLLDYFRKSLATIQNQNAGRTDVDVNQYFRAFSNNCVTMLYNGLSRWGINRLNRRLPWNFFLSCRREFSKLAAARRWQVSVRKLPQLKVPEAPFSAQSAA